MMFSMSARDITASNTMAEYCAYGSKHIWQLSSAVNPEEVS